MGQNCLASASDSSMLLATRSFLSALSFCFKISMLVSATLGSAAVWSAKAEPAKSMAPVRKHAISLYMGHVLSDVGEVSHALKHYRLEAASSLSDWAARFSSLST